MNKNINLVVICLIFSLFIGALPWRELKADANTYGEYDGYPLFVTYNQVSTWEYNTQGEVTIKNISEFDVENWTLEIVFESALDLVNLWNGQDLRNETTEANSLIIGSELYNSIIVPGESITFGMELVGTEIAPVAPISITVTNVELRNTLSGGTIYQEDIVCTESESVAIEANIGNNSLFPYAIFVNSNIAINGWKSTIKGDIYSGGDYIYQGSEFYIDGCVKTVGSIDNDTALPIAFFKEPNVYQQCRYYREGTYEFKGCVYQEIISGINIICENCYDNDYMLSYEVPNGATNYIPSTDNSFFDPVIE